MISSTGEPEKVLLCDGSIRDYEPFIPNGGLRGILPNRTFLSSDWLGPEDCRLYRS